MASGGGVIAGISCFFINMPLYLLIGEDALPAYIKNFTGATFIEQLSVVAIGAIVGRIHDISRKTKKTLNDLKIANIKTKNTLNDLNFAKASLKQANEKLEQRVKERTLKIQIQNEQLSRECGQRRQVEKALRYRFKLEELVVSISTDFIKLSLDEIDQGINNALESIGKFVNIDRIFVFFIQDNRTLMDMAYEWVNAGIDSKLDQSQALKVKTFPWLMEKLNRGETIYIPNIAELPPEAAAEQNIYISRDIRSCVGVPIMYGEILKGFLGIISVHEEKKWLDEDIVLLKSVGDVFINALERKKSEEIHISEKMKSEFLTNITHEFRTPLTLALGPLDEVLHAGNLKNEEYFLEQLRLSFKNVKKLLNLINQLLNVSSLEAGAAVLSYQKRDIHQFVSEIISFFMTIATRKNIQIFLSPPDDELTAYIDPEKMDKVLANVIGNSFKFTPEGGNITVKCRSVHIDDANVELQYFSDKTTEFIEITVQDTGIGIKEENLGKIFDRFYHKDTTHYGVRGTGIGLTLAKQLIELQNGSITAQSVFGKGSTFTIRIPKGKDHITDECLIRQENTELNITQDTKEYIILHELEEEDETADHKDAFAGDKELILVVDDNSDMRKYIKNTLSAEYSVTLAKDGENALEIIKNEVPSLIISDIMMPVMDGHYLCRELKSNPKFSYIPFIFLTAITEMEMKITGLEEGADEYIVKPFSPMELKARIKSLLKNRQLMRENMEKEERIASLTRTLETRCTYRNIVGQSKQMEKIFQIMELTKNSEHPLLITGETGTGKELIAKTIHYIGDKKNKPYIVQNCSAFSENLLESEIFGHVKGAFTGAIQDKKGLFEMANGGTLFLDEIGELSPNTQAKLLRILEFGTFYPVGGSKEKKVKVKLITATNKNLKACVKEQTFREDLYYRLNVINIALPPLREHKEDILLLIEHFIDELNKKYTGKKHFTKPALKVLMEYSYPGNIRELKNIVDKSYILCPGKAIQPEDLTSELWEETEKVTNITKPLINSDKPTHKIKRQQLIEALTAANKNKAKAAKILETTRPTLYKLIKQYNINLDNL